MLYIIYGFIVSHISYNIRIVNIHNPFNICYIITTIITLFIIVLNTYFIIKLFALFKVHTFIIKIPVWRYYCYKYVQLLFYQINIFQSHALSINTKLLYYYFINNISLIIFIMSFKVGHTTKVLITNLNLLTCYQNDQQAHSINQSYSSNSPLN